MEATRNPVESGFYGWNVIVRGIIIGIDWLVWCIKKNLEGFREKDIVVVRGERLYPIFIIFFQTLEQGNKRFI